MPLPRMLRQFLPLKRDSKGHHPIESGADNTRVAVRIVSLVIQSEVEIDVARTKTHYCDFVNHPEGSLDTFRRTPVPIGRKSIAPCAPIFDLPSPR